MTKADKTAETIEFPTFDTSKAADQFRTFAEKGAEQSKEAYDRMKSGVETTQKALENSFETARAAGTDVSLKSINTMRANADLGFSHLEAMVAAKSMSEMIELQTAYVRKSVEMAIENARDIQSVSSKAAEDVSKPMKDVFEKTMREHKAA